MVPTPKSSLRRIVLALDGLIVLISMGLAYLLHGALRGVVPWLKNPPALAQYLHLVYLTLPLFLLLLALFCRPLPDRLPRPGQLLADLIKVHLAALLGLTALLFLTQAVINRSLVGLFFGCSLCLLYLERSALVLWRRYQYDRGLARLRLLLVGLPGEAMTRFVARARSAPLPPRVLGFLHDEPGDGRAPVEAAADSWTGAPVYLGGLSRLETVLHEEAVDRVIFFPPLNRPADVSDALALCQTLGVPADFAVVLPPELASAARVVELHEQPFISLEARPKPPEQLALKHGLDLVVAAAALVLTAPLLLLVTLAILVSMGRPVLFVQQRTGLHGRVFRMYKFRTMRPGAEQERDELLPVNEMSGPVFKAENDPRVTPLGRLLRRTSIDELPQLLNVLKGEMSLVGPRPLPVQEQQEIHGWRRRRLSMKPGLTGLWQVSGRNAVDFHDWMRLDLSYVDRWSLSLDLVILLRTVPAVLLRRGAR